MMHVTLFFLLHRAQGQTDLTAAGALCLLLSFKMLHQYRYHCTGIALLLLAYSFKEHYGSLLAPSTFLTHIPACMCHYHGFCVRGCF